MAVRRPLRFLLMPILALLSVFPTMGLPAERIVAVGDIHGDFQAFSQLLVTVGLIDDAGRWQGGQTHLVSLGDLLDRGPDSRRVMDLLRRLEGEAQAAGGRVHVLLGNHELMNLTGDLQDVSEAEFAAFDSREGHARAFSASGEYGKWLLSKPSLLRLHDTLFVHGGVTAEIDDVNAVNARVWEHLTAIKTEAEQFTETKVIAPGMSLLELVGTEYPQLSDEFYARTADPVFGLDGPFWYRGNALCHELIEGGVIEENLARLSVARVVVGHTPTLSREVSSRFDGQVWLIDTGMLSKVYHGQARALELTFKNQQTQVRALPVDVAKILSVEDLARKRDEKVLRQLQQSELRLEDEQWVLRDGNDTLGVDFVSARKSHRQQQLAAYLLDRALGFGFVQPLAIRQHAGRAGIVRIEIDTIAEADRDFAFASYCHTQSTQGTEYDLVSVFDSLIGKLDRSGTDLRYHARTRSIVLTDNHTGFSSNSQLPRYAHQPVLSKTLAMRLRGLDENALQTLLGSLLKTSQIKGILKRRDKILDWGRAP